MDYQKLIQDFRNAAYKWERNHPIIVGELHVCDALRDAATAIEALLAERDALLQILKEQSDCDLCKHNATPPPCWDEVDIVCAEDCGHEKVICCECRGDNWEWRGLKSTKECPK